MRTSFHRCLASVTVIAAVLTGCSGDRSSDAVSPQSAISPSVSEDAAPAETVAAGEGFVDGAKVDTSTNRPENPVTSATTVSALTNRKIIRNAEIAIEVDNVPKATAQLRDLAASTGGLLAGEQASYGATDQIVLTFRVPVTQFEVALNRLGKIGSVLSTNVTSEEVTAQFRDTESRLRSKRVSAERLRQLITKAVKASDILEIETELANREAEIEAMQGQLNMLDDRASLSTIVVSVYGKGDGRVAEIRESEDPSFTRAMRGSVGAIGDIGKALAAATGAVLPFLPFVGLIGALIATLLRRRKRKALLTSPASDHTVSAGRPVNGETDTDGVER